MQVKILAVATLTLLVGISAQGAIADDPPAARFAEEIHVFGVEDEVYPPPACATLFVGSSSIRFWFHLRDDFAEQRTIRRGFGGATIPDVNFYFDAVIGKYSPARIVFYAGENDLNAGRPVDEVFHEFMKFLDLKDRLLGSTPVYFVSAKPSVARLSDLGRQEALNRKISALADERADLAFVDIASPMLKEGSPDPALFISDQLHMRAGGYEIWRGVIQHALDEDDVSEAQYCR